MTPQTPKLLSSQVFYWKRSLLLGRPKFTRCQLDLLSNGWLVWTKDQKPKGTVCLTDAYDEIKLLHANERKFFNAIPVQIRMAPYVLIVPMMRRGGIEEEICFVFETDADVSRWLTEASRCLHAGDLFDEERRRAAKELLSNARGGEEDDDEEEKERIEKMILPTAWYQFKNALKSMDGMNAVRLTWQDVQPNGS